MTNSLDKWDYIAAISSGGLCASLDAIFVKDYKLEDAQAWKNELTALFLNQVRDNRTKTEKKIHKQINKLDKKIGKSEDIFSEQRVKKYESYIKYATDIPGVKSLAYIITNYFTDGELPELEDVPTGDELEAYLQERLFRCVVIWGLSSLKSYSISKKDDTKSVPAQMRGILENLYSMPAIKELMDSADSRMLSEMTNWFFEKKNLFLEGKEQLKSYFKKLSNAFDTKTVNPEFPIVLNDAIVCAFYSIRRFIIELSNHEIKTVKDLGKLELRNFLPMNNATLLRMRTVASGTFTLGDVSAAAIKSAVKNKGFNENTVTDILTQVNFTGVFVLGRNIEKMVAENKENIDETVEHKPEIKNDIEVTKIQKTQQSELVKPTPEERINQIVVDATSPEAKKMYSNIQNCVMVFANKADPKLAAFSVYSEIQAAIAEYEAAVERRIQQEYDTAHALEAISDYRADIQASVEAYMTEHMEAFACGFDKMEQAIADNDVDAFIEGNNSIQSFLGHEVQFTNQEEFDDLMSSDEVFKL